MLKNRKVQSNDYQMRTQRFVTCFKIRFNVLVGLLILFRSALFLYYLFLEGQYNAVDSWIYLTLAGNLQTHLEFSLSPQAPFDPEVFRTPGYPFFLAAIGWLGMENPYWAIFWQELIYTGCIVLFYVCSKPLFGNKISCASVIFLLLEPGGLAYPKLILSETLFLPLFFTAFFAIGFYLRHLDGRYLIVAGVFMGLAAIVRPAIMYFPVVTVGTLLCFDFRNHRKWKHAGLLLIAFALIISPWLFRNHQHFGKFFMSGQTSNMLANYHVPIVWESAADLSFSRGSMRIKNKVQLAVDDNSRHLERPLTKVEVFEVQQQVALQELAKFPFAYASQWLFGIFKTLYGPNLTELYHTFHLRTDRLHYFDIQSSNFAEKVFVYAIHQDIPVLIEVLFRVIISLFAILGILQILKTKDCLLCLLLLANLYFICLPGPMGYARFRFPVEGFWFIQAYLGGIWLMALIQRRKHRTKVF